MKFECLQLSHTKETGASRFLFLIELTHQYNSKTNANTNDAIRI